MVAPMEMIVIVAVSAAADADAVSSPTSFLLRPPVLLSTRIKSPNLEVPVEDTVDLRPRRTTCLLDVSLAEKSSRLY
eukprot:scaffold28426_cov37-Cyclotella_meneghiniana.AAC.3